MSDHWPEALVALIDALENFIEIDKRMGDELLAEQSISISSHRAGMQEVAAMERLLRKLKQLGSDPTLDGTVEP